MLPIRSVFSAASIDLDFTKAVPASALVASQLRFVPGAPVRFSFRHRLFQIKHAQRVTAKGLVYTLQFRERQLVQQLAGFFRQRRPRRRRDAPGEKAFRVSRK